MIWKALKPNVENLSKFEIDTRKGAVLYTALQTETQSQTVSIFPVVVCFYVLAWWPVQGVTPATLIRIRMDGLFFKWLESFLIHNRSGRRASVAPAVEPCFYEKINYPEKQWDVQHDKKLTVI